MKRLLVSALARGLCAWRLRDRRLPSMEPALATSDAIGLPTDPDRDRTAIRVSFRGASRSQGRRKSRTWPCGGRRSSPPKRWRISWFRVVDRRHTEQVSGDRRRGRRRALALGGSSGSYGSWRRRSASGFDLAARYAGVTKQTMEILLGRGPKPDAMPDAYDAQSILNRSPGR